MDAKDAIRDTRTSPSKRRQRSAEARRLKLGSMSDALAQRLSLLIFHKKSRRAPGAQPTNLARPQTSPRPLINEVQEARIAAMPFDILSYLGDREEMAHSLEARLPFLDHKLYDAAKWIPVDFKIRDHLEKAVLRDAAKGILPEDLRLRRKSGFMLTSEAVDFLGTDRMASKALRTTYLSIGAFEGAQLFSYRGYFGRSLLARCPTWNRLPFLRRLRRLANKSIMYMMQGHMLHEMFVADPLWLRPATARPTYETVH